MVSSDRHGVHTQLDRVHQVVEAGHAIVTARLSAGRDQRHRPRRTHSFIGAVAGVIIFVLESAEIGVFDLAGSC